MNWVSTMGWKFIQAYSEGLVMTCPLYHGELLQTGRTDGADRPSPAAIDQSQADVGASFRPEYAEVVRAQAASQVQASRIRH